MKTFNQNFPIVDENQKIFIVKKFLKNDHEKFLTYAVCAKDDATESDIIIALKLNRRVDADGYKRTIINTEIRPYKNCVNDKQFEFSQL